jgi:hypothetical protein
MKWIKNKLIKNLKLEKKHTEKIDNHYKFPIRF